MGLTAIDPNKYGKLLSKALPRVISDDEEFDRMAARLEELDFSARALTPEEVALRDLVATLVADYDERQHPLPALPPHKMLRFLMEQRGLRQADLVAAVGSRSQVSDLCSGKRAISKAQAKKLAAFFGVGVELFI